MKWFNCIFFVCLGLAIFVACAQAKDRTLDQKLLTKPKDFASARIWATTDYVYASDDALKREPHWRVHVYHFDAQRLLHETNDRGPGTAAPDSYFRFSEE